MTNEELILFVKRKMRYTRKAYREPWVELLNVLEYQDRRENSLAKQIKKLGISQADIADQLGLARCTVSVYLSGKRTPPKWFMEKLTELMK